MHKLYSKGAKSFDVVIVEDINLQHMSLFLSFNGYGMQREMLSCKLSEREEMQVKDGRLFPSNKRCLVCLDMIHT